MLLEATTAVLIAATPQEGVRQQPPGCPPHEIWRDTLSQKFGENRIFKGITGTGDIVRIYMNFGSGTWTATLENAGFECQKAHGRDGILSPGARMLETTQ
tara:strand:- start:925 stop:1224 length:300 start_codon:yes stop_codon:yes gene_type:complete